MHLIVHIGTGKTGSSSIQKTLAANNDGLSRAATAYVGLMGETLPDRRYGWQKAGGWPQLIGLGPEVARQQLSDMLGMAVAGSEAAGVQHVIWSNESIFGNHEIVLPVLKDLQARGVQVSIIVYLRRHDAWARSAYFQWGIKHKTYKGPIKSFAEWYKDHKPNFSSGLKPWLLHEWHDVSIRNFDACGDVVADFLKYCGLDVEKFPPVRENETPNPVALALWGLFNTQFHEKVLPAELERLLRQAGVLQKPILPFDWNALLPSQGDLNDVAENAATDRAFLDDLLQREGQLAVQTSELVHKDMLVSQSQINAALLLVVKHQGDQIEVLKRRLDALATKPI